MSKITYGTENFLHIANEYVNPDTSTMEGVEKWLIGWFCFKFETTTNDARLLELTIEELFVLYNMHQIRDNPNYFNEQLNPKDPTGYEAWLKKEMGESYETNDEMVAGIKKEEVEYQSKIAEKYPDKVDTDFSQFQED